jgi:hypothetical protein
VVLILRAKWDYTEQVSCSAVFQFRNYDSSKCYFIFYFSLMSYWCWDHSANEIWGWTVSCMDVKVVVAYLRWYVGIYWRDWGKPQKSSGWSPTLNSNWWPPKYWLGNDDCHSLCHCGFCQFQQVNARTTLENSHDTTSHFFHSTICNISCIINTSVEFPSARASMDAHGFSAGLCRMMLPKLV